MFQFRNLSIAAALMLAPLGHASTIAVIDSGVDIKHPDLQGKIWTNPSEKLNFKDDDGNGFKDDVNGWNFFANNNTIIDLKYTSLYNTEIDEFFLVQDKFLAGTATEADMNWIKEKASDPEFVSAITKYGTFVHGTHVAGITANGHDAAKVLTIRLVPVENPLLQLEKDVIRAQKGQREISKFTKTLIKGTLFLLAQAQGAAFGMVGEYVGKTNVDIANASLGIGVNQARMIITPIVKLAAKGEEDPALIDELTVHFLNHAVSAQKKIATAAPKTLFVFASGNDGSDNDVFPVSPANAMLDNTISVGASVDYRGIAPFSNYGRTTVDVLAPGVGIVSSVPGSRQMALSGTSQAAPFVAGVAGGMKDVNPQLSPLELKTLIIGTVDLKPELADKVVSGGIANRDRALYAAELSKTLPLAEAMEAARAAVADQPVSASLVNADAVIPTPLGSPIVAPL